MRWTVTITMLLALASTAHADPFALKSSHTGNIEYVFVGAALTNNTGLSNGVNCLLQTAAAAINANMLSANPNLVSATLYLSGSLLEDGVDYSVNNLQLFSPGANASTDALETAARAAAAVQVNFKPPGAAAAQLVTGQSADAYVTTYYVPPSSPPAQGNVAFFTTPIDVTAVINGPGKGVLVGNYEVDSSASASNPQAGQVLGDVCNGLEIICSSDPNNVCKGSAVHDNGTASFGLLLIYEDLALPLYSVNVFEGLYDLNGATQVINLTNLAPISSPAAGALSYYVVEGDITLPGNTGTPLPCGQGEFLKVNGNPSVSSANANCFNDADNPPGNIFNGTINTEAATAAPSSQCPNINLCCGPDLCGLAGVDIDRYDISSALAPGATEIDVTLGTVSDRVAVASVVLGAQVFQALLSADTQFRTFGTVDDAAQVGNTVTYSLAISNTGNIDANDVVVSVDAPAGVTGFKVLGGPPGAQSNINATGGINGTGTVAYSGFNVQAGKVQEVRFIVNTQCTQLGQALDVVASIAGQNVTAFTTPAPTLTVGGPGVGPCAGLDPYGPFSEVDPVMLLRGGGCTATQTGSGAGLLVGMLAWVWSRLRGRAPHLGKRTRPVWNWKRPRAPYRSPWPILSLSAAVLATSACGNQHPAPAAKEPQSITSTDGLPGQPCGGSNLMLLVSPANSSAFCIDRFEASSDGGALGNAQQSGDDTVINTDGSTKAKAQVALGTQPITGVSWFQAKSICVNAGKRLCTQTEWEYACRGATGQDYPYGNAVNEAACNGFFQYNLSNPARTGSFKACVSGAGVYDLSGNVEEWLDTPVPRQPNTTINNDRATHGGSYNSNDAALACVGVQFHAPPSSSSSDRGFRCCMDAPQ